MFGHLIKESEPLPYWIESLVSSIERLYKIKINKVCYKEPKRNKDYYNGCYWSQWNIIELYFGREKTDLRTWIVLHELAHAIQHLKKDNLPNNKNRKRRICHNKRFFEIAYELFCLYNVEHIAIEKEYKKGRKVIADMINKK